MRPLTAKQLKVLKIIKDGIANGKAPMFKEIAEQMGFVATSNSAKYIAALERKGFISRTRCKRRSIVLLERTTA
jgi:SOS-response transcriptional repressor LexA